MGVKWKAQVRRVAQVKRGVSQQLDASCHVTIVTT